VPDRSKKVPGWPGYVSKGSGHFFIYKKVAGKLYEVRTPATTMRAALKQLERFEENPEGYKPEGEAPRGALVLDQDLARAFLEWSRDEKGNTLKWVTDQRRALAWWGDRLAGLDLRRVSTEKLLGELDGATGRKQLIATLKAFYSWLRTERHLVKTAEDPTYGQLKVPQAKPRQWEVRKAATREEYDAALEKLEGWPRDALIVLGGTGWHATELERFVEGVVRKGRGGEGERVRGAIEKHPHSGRPVLVCPQTKGGAPLKTEVESPVAEAAERLLKRGALNYFRFRDALKRVGASFNPGYLRHSVATWAMNEGADPASVAAFLGHKSAATTRKFYATHGVPAKVPTLADVTPRKRKRGE
jgi:integrase